MYSVYDRDVGYVQGMGFVAGLLLLYISEEDAFWLLVALLKGVGHSLMGGLYLYAYGASNRPTSYHSGLGSNQVGYVPGTGHGPNQNNVSQAYVPPSAVGGNQYQNQNRGYVADGQNPGSYSAPQNAGYGQGSRIRTPIVRCRMGMFLKMVDRTRTKVVVL